MTEQPLESVHAIIYEDVTFRLVVMVALAEQSVEIMSYKPESRIFYAAKHRVIVARP